MSDPAVDMLPIAYGRMPQFGPEHLLARIDRGETPAGLDLLDVEQPPPPSASNFAAPETLAERLVATNAGWGNALDPSQVRAAASEGRFVIAEQQPGLLAGPLYSLLKAVTSVKLADEISIAAIKLFRADIVQRRSRFHVIDLRGELHGVGDFPCEKRRGAECF